MSAALELVEPKELMRLDLGCGENLKEGFVGVDIAENLTTTRFICDLTVTPWPFDDESCEELHCSHFIEHLTGDQRIAFFNEAARILIKGGKLTVVVPYWNSRRQWQDPTHKNPVPETFGQYFNKGWRESQKLTHGPYAAIVCDFDYSWGYIWDNASRFATSTDEARHFQLTHYSDAVLDTHFTFIKR